MAIDRHRQTPGVAARRARRRPPARRRATPASATRSSKLISAVDGSAAEANEAVGRMLDGTGDVHEAMIALQKADTMLQLTVQIRNKLVQAYQDVMRMPV